MAEFLNTTGCDKCGQDQCNCPQCDCKWCRYNRGEASQLERAQIDAIYTDDARKSVRESAARMSDNIARLTADKGQNH